MKRAVPFPIRSADSKQIIRLLLAAECILAACVPTKPEVFPSTFSASVATTATKAVTPTPVTWPLPVQLESGLQTTKATPESLWQLIPGTSIVQDLYATVGYPQKRKDFSDGIALLYPSLWVKDPHIVLLDGVTGKIVMVAIENISRPIFSLVNLEAQYGKATRAFADERDYLFFPNAGLAAIVENRDNSHILYIQRLPREMTIEAYEVHQGFSQVTFGFVP